MRVQTSAAAPRGLAAAGKTTVLGSAPRVAPSNGPTPHIGPCSAHMPPAAAAAATRQPQAQARGRTCHASVAARYAAGPLTPRQLQYTQQQRRQQQQLPAIGSIRGASVRVGAAAADAPPSSDGGSPRRSSGGSGGRGVAMTTLGGGSLGR
eukprot:352695-Chlamydomonas_euryale.AAC.2